MSSGRPRPAIFLIAMNSSLRAALVPCVHARTQIPIVNAFRSRDKQLDTSFLCHLQSRYDTNPRKIGDPDLPHRWKKGTWRKKRQAIEHAIFDESDRRRSASLGRSGRRNIARLSYRLLDRATTVVSVATCSNHLRDLALHRIILTRMIASSKRSSRRDAPCEATRAPSS